MVEACGLNRCSSMVGNNQSGLNREGTGTKSFVFLRVHPRLKSIDRLDHMLDLGIG